MPKLLRRILKYPAWLFARLGIVGPLVFFYARVIKEVGPGHSRGDGNLPTLFALTSNRFRGDLEILARTGEFRVLQVPFAWQARLVNLFYPLDTPREAMLQPEADEKIARMQKRYRHFLRAFLPALYKKLGVDCVIGAAIGYVQDLDWGAVSEEVGVPYVVLQRENLVTNRGRIKYFTDKCRKLGKFHGSHIITHNETIREIFVRSGYVASDRISSLGCLRMDEFVGKVRAHKGNPNRRKKVVFFSFGPGTGLLGITTVWPRDRDVGLVKFFERSHAAFGELARDHPEVDFVLKPKWGGRWVSEVERVLRLNGTAPGDCENLHILPDADAQRLILESDVVCGFGSTTLLEAGIAGKPVVVPHFDETLSPKFRDHVLFQEHFQLFDIARSPAELKSLILERLENPAVDEACMRERRAAFEEIVSSLKGDATEKYAVLLKRIVGENENLPVSPIANSPMRSVQTPLQRNNFRS